MVKEYRKLSHSFEEVKAENSDLKNSSAEPGVVELGEADSLKIELSKLTAEKKLLRNESSELKAKIERLNEVMSSWNQSPRSLHKLQESQKPANDRTGLGFNSSETAKEKQAQRRRSAAAISVQQMVRNISISSWFDAFKESAVELAMETSRVDSVVRNQASVSGALFIVNVQEQRGIAPPGCISSAKISKLSPVDMLTSSLLLTAFSSRYADVIIADTSSCATDSRLLLFIFFFDISSSRLHRFCSRSHFCMRPVLFPPKRSNEQDCSELLRFWPNSFV
ncbi:hypothetical protein F511_25263 [Dorcoceras hygrometricum]|uniref:Uncharacterized protein n=1 Tax=Dorcoceras hygrometricum TaxID=472368 RepID=A0A2Z7C4E5_9LAMI|nr:hypothetical protein F511_25263 [Dorcoceras hygrometricum]